MSREVHAGFCERRGVRLPPATHPVLDLWARDGGHGGDRSSARRELIRAAGSVTGWYEHFAASLAGAEGVPEPLAPDQVANGRLLHAVGRDLRGSDGQATMTGVRVIWTGDHLDAARRLQGLLAEPARTAVSEHALDPMNDVLRRQPRR